MEVAPCGRGANPEAIPVLIGCRGKAAAVAVATRAVAGHETIRVVRVRESWPDGSVRPTRRGFPVMPNYPIRRESWISPYLVRFQSERAAGGGRQCLRVPPSGVLLKSAGGRRRLFVVFSPSGRRPHARHFGHYPHDSRGSTGGAPLAPGPRN